jgi:hypothetical protein
MIGPIRLFTKSYKTEEASNILESINNDTYKFLYSHNKKYVFEFDDNKNIYFNHGSHFLSCGSHSAVFSIVDTQNIFHDVLLKLSDDTLDDFLTCIEKYTHDYQQYSNNIMKMYMWGMLCDKKNKHVANFMIVKRYELFSQHNIKILTIENKLNMIYDFVLFLSKLSETNIWLRDIKMANIGYDIINGQYKIVVIDYDNLTTLSNHDCKTLINTEGSFGLILSSGTYVPYYLSKHYLELITIKQRKEKFEKIKKLIISKCKTMEEVKINTFDNILKFSNYKEPIKNQIISIYNKNVNVSTFTSQLFSLFAELNYSEYQSTITNFLNEMNKITSTPLAIIIATLLYDQNPIYEQIKINEYLNFQKTLIHNSSLEYEALFKNITNAKSLLTNENDNAILNTTLSKLLKPNYLDVISYSEIITLLNGLSYFSKNKNFNNSLDFHGFSNNNHKICSSSSIVTINSQDICDIV